MTSPKPSQRRRQAERQRQAATGDPLSVVRRNQSPPEPSEPLEPQYLRTLLPPPRPVSPCRECDGDGVTGDLFEQRTGADGEFTLLVDELCPQCLGCGDRDCHCDPGELYDIDPGDEADGEEFYAAAGYSPCPSCADRGWNPISGYRDPDDDQLTFLKMPCGCMSDFTVHTTDPTADRPRPVPTISDRDTLAASLEADGWTPAAAADIAAADLTDYDPLGPYPEVPETDGLFAQGDLPAVIIRAMGFKPPRGDDAHTLTITGPDGAERTIAVTAQTLVYAEHPAMLIRVVNVDAGGDDTYGEQLLDAWQTDLAEHGFGVPVRPSGFTVTVTPGETPSHAVQATIGCEKYTLFTGPVLMAPSWLARAKHLDNVVVFAGPLGFHEVPREPVDDDLAPLLTDGAITATKATVTVTETVEVV